MWQLDQGSHKWREQAALSGHTDWVRDAAWAPNLGLPMSTIASCGQDGQVLVWSEGEKGWSKQVTQLPAACRVWALHVMIKYLLDGDISLMLQCSCLKILASPSGRSAGLSRVECWLSQIAVAQ